MNLWALVFFFSFHIWFLSTDDSKFSKIIFSYADVQNDILKIFLFILSHYSQKNNTAAQEICSETRTLFLFYKMWFIKQHMWRKWLSVEINKLVLFFVFNKCFWPQRPLWSRAAMVSDGIETCNLLCPNVRHLFPKQEIEIATPLLGWSLGCHLYLECATFGNVDHLCSRQICSMWITEPFVHSGSIRHVCTHFKVFHSYSEDVTILLFVVISFQLLTLLTIQSDVP